MNKLILTSVLLLGILNTLAQPTWVWQNPLPAGFDLNTVYFLNSSTGFAGGNNGTVLRTTNGGLNWVAVNAGINDNVHSIIFTDANTGYMGAGKYQGLMFKTTNAGLNWTSKNLGLPYGPRSINFINSNTGVAAYQSTGIIMTTNAGANWQEVITGINYNTAAWMTSAATIYTAGSSNISKTTNGGVNWSSQSIGTGDILSICFADSLNGLVCGRQGLIRRTSNGGTNWNVITSGTALDIFSIRYINAGTVVASVQGGGYLKSTDSGNNWVINNLSESYFNNLLSVMAINANEIFVCGSYGTICKSTNGGANWQQLFASINNEIFYSCFIDDNNGYASSFNSVIKTTNGGANWTKLNSISFGGPMYFRNPNTGFQAAMYSGLLYKTTNGGVDYTSVITGYPSSFRSISFTNDFTGYIVTTSAKTLKTTNSGSNWFQIDSTIDAYYTDITFTDSLTGYISGMKNNPAASLIKKTTNGGNLWVEQTINSSLGISLLYFVNSNTGFAGSNNSGQNFFKTTNGGINWIAGSPVSPYINNMTFVNENTGYACSMFGYFYRTTNGGNNWLQLTTPVDYNIRTVYHNNNTGVTYLMGTGGMILKSTNGSITGFEHENTGPKNYYIKQNYPNPFNPVTQIEFSIPVNDFVTLKIYDVTGSEIAVLIDGKVNAGIHNVNFDGTNMPSGVYFYRLKTAALIETKKMILIK